MSKKTQLVEILHRLDDEETTAAARDEARRFLSEISPGELADLERELVEEGMSLAHIGGLCQSHLEAAGGAGAELRARLADDHVVAVLMEEHQYILRHLQRLAELTAVEGPDLGAPETRERLGEVRDTARRLIDFEPHHQREEQALFPALIARGVHGPPTMMQREHVELRALKHAVHDAAGKMLDTRGAEWPALVAAVENLVSLLRSHIAREDNILYPMAVAALDEETWAEIGSLCDEIGYPVHRPGDPPLTDRIHVAPAHDCGHGG